MITPIHTLFNLVIFLLLGIIINPNYADLILLLSAELIDLDHLFSKPIYHPGRNPFKKHILHRNWLIILIISIALLFIRPVMFLGIGLISHLFIDCIYVKFFVNNKLRFNQKSKEESE